MDRKSDFQMEDEVQEQQFAYHEDLLIAQDVIEKYYSERECIAYRTFLTNPPTETDITPQVHRRQPDVNIGLSQEEYDNLTEKERKEYVSKRALSVHTTEEKEIKEAKRFYNKIKKSRTKMQLKYISKSNEGLLLDKSLLHQKLVYSLVSKRGTAISY